jgi:hypothetical protein
VDERLTGHATNEGVDHVSIGDVWELIALLGEALNVLPETRAPTNMLLARIVNIRVRHPLLLE